MLKFDFQLIAISPLRRMPLDVRGCLHETRNEIYSKWNFNPPWDKFSLHYFSLRAKWSEISFQGWSEKNGPFSKSQSFLFWWSKCADASIHHSYDFILRSVISVKIEMNIFHFARNEISCKHPFGKGLI